MTAKPKNSLLILVPALNEEGAVGGVVRAIRGYFLKHKPNTLKGSSDFKSGFHEVRPRPAWFLFS